MGMKKTVDMEWGDLDIFVDGQLVLHIGQVSDNDTIDLFLYPKGDIVRSLMAEEGWEDTGCTHEILAKRNEKKTNGSSLMFKIEGNKIGDRKRQKEINHE
jgi:hypothetical protein